MKKPHLHSPEGETVISISGLYKSFGDSPVLRGVDLEIHRGENLVVLGRSGTGKSVLIKMIVGLLRPDSGRVTVLGHDVPTLGPKELDELRLRIGFSFQNSALYDSMNVRQNLEFPMVMTQKHIRRAELNQRVEEALDAVGLLEKIDNMPADLSGGQRKRIGIARTLIMKPEIMLYDEPTAGLDPITCLEINDLINEVQEKFHTTGVIITHDLACAKATGDRVAMMLDGRFLKVGSFSEIFSIDDERVQSFYNYNFAD